MKLAAVSHRAVAVCLVSSLVLPVLPVSAEPGGIISSSDPTPLKDAMSFRDLDAETNGALQEAYRNHDSLAVQRIRSEYRSRLAQLQQRRQDAFRSRRAAAEKHNQDVEQAMRILNSRFPNQGGKVGIAIREIAGRDDVIAAAEAYGNDQPVRKVASSTADAVVAPPTVPSTSGKEKNDSEQNLQDALNWSKHPVRVVPDAKESISTAASTTSVASDKSNHSNPEVPLVKDYDTYFNARKSHPNVLTRDQFDNYYKNAGSSPMSPAQLETYYANRKEFGAIDDANMARINAQNEAALKAQQKLRDDNDKIGNTILGAIVGVVALGIAADANEKERVSKMTPEQRAEYYQRAYEQERLDHMNDNSRNGGY